MEPHEVLIYHHLYNKSFGTVILNTAPKASYSTETKGRPFFRVLHTSAKIMAVLGFTALILAFGPNLAWLASASYLEKTAQNALPTVTTTVKKPDDYMPSFDPALGMAGRLVISSIGVRPHFSPATLANHEDALK